MTSDPWLVRHGRAEPTPERLALRAGPIALDFEDGDLRWLRVGGAEAIRRIYATVRDRDWATYPVRIQRLEREVEARSFRIAYDAEHAGTDSAGERIAFRARVEIRGGEDGAISFAWDGECLADMLSCRVGICLLHPAACAGEWCAVEHLDGSRSEGRFPTLISPWQPFKEMRAVTIRPLPGVELEARLAGETFEMEDQRNWTDGSFKTYSRPLGEPPYHFPIRRGERFRQSVTLRLRGAAPEPVAPRRGAVTITDASSGPVPRIGVGFDGSENAAVAARLGLLAHAHLRVIVDLADAAWRARWPAAVTMARALRRQIDAVVACPEDPRAMLAELAGVAAGAPIASWQLVGRNAPTPAGLVAQARSALAAAVPGAVFGGGVRSYFTLLNRGRPPVDDWQVYGFEVNAEVHATDAPSIMDNLEGLAPVVASAVALAQGAAISVSATLAPPGRSDERQGSLFAAAWTVGALAGLSAARTVFCHTAAGAAGVIDDDGAPRPAWHVLADVLEREGTEVARVTISDPLATAVLALRRGKTLRVLVANLRAEPSDVTIDGIASGQVRALDERSAERARRDPEAWRAAWEPMRGSSLHLLPYAVATIDA